MVRRPPRSALFPYASLLRSLLQVSVAAATPVALVRVSAGQVSVTPAGQVMLGGLVSCTVMVWTQLARLVQASVDGQSGGMGKRADLGGLGTIEKQMTMLLQG